MSVRTVAEIAAEVGGRVDGDGSIRIDGVAAVSDAEPGQITFVVSPRYAAEAARSRAAAIVTGPDLELRTGAALIRVADPDAAFARIALLFAPPPALPAAGIHSSAVVAATATVGAGARIGPYCVLEPGVRVGDRSVLFAGCYLGHGTTLGRDCRLYPHVTLRENTTVGDRVIIHNGSVIGSDGYGYVPERRDGRLVITKIPQLGRVVIGDDVEIGANVTVDRARLGATRIGNRVKIDNLVHVAHNVTIGDDTGIVAQVGISGSTSVGSRVILWGQAGVAGHLKIGDDARIGAKAGVTKDVAAGSTVSGYPAMDHARAKRLHAELVRVPALRRRLADIADRLARLEARQEVRPEEPET